MNKKDVVYKRFGELLPYQDRVYVIPLSGKYFARTLMKRILERHNKHSSYYNDMTFVLEKYYGCLNMIIFDTWGCYTVEYYDDTVFAANEFEAMKVQKHLKTLTKDKCPLCKRHYQCECKACQKCIQGDCGFEPKIETDR